MTTVATKTTTTTSSTTTTTTMTATTTTATTKTTASTATTTTKLGVGRRVDEDVDGTVAVGEPHYGKLERGRRLEGGNEALGQQHDDIRRPEEKHEHAGKTNKAAEKKMKRK